MPFRFRASTQQLAALSQPLTQALSRVKMSTFGGPGGQQYNAKPIPPERGSFPLDHDGECKKVMMSYLACIRKVRGTNEPECRELAKGYLGCRMDRNLMARDEFKNLGFKDEKDAPKGSGGGTKGELNW